MPTQQPWLDNKNWADNAIASDARHGHWVLWGAALFWNLVTLPALLQVEEIWKKVEREPVTLLFVLFPLTGIWLVVLAVQATRQRTRFGLTPLVLDPFPGSLGGHVGGSVGTRIPYRASQFFPVNLTCIHSRVSTSGKRRSRSESIVWQSEGVCHTERGRDGTVLRFRFDLPADLPVSEPHSNSYHLWRLRIRTELPGIDFDRRWELPVFDTGGQVSGIAEGTESNPATVDAAMAGLESVVDITPLPAGIQARFPALQRPGMGIGMVLFGSVFTGIGVVVGVKGGMGYLFAAVFGLLGILIAVAGVFYLGKSLLVAVGPDGVRSRRFFLGYPIRTRQLSAAELTDIEIRKSGTLQSGKTTTVLFQLYARGKGRAFPVAERLHGRPEAELLRDTYLTYLGRGKAHLEDNMAGRVR